MADIVLGAVKYAGILVIASIFGLAGVGVVVMMLRAASERHPMLGLGVAVLALALVVWALRWVQKETLSPISFGMYPRTGLVLNLAILVLVSAVAMATVSDALYRAGLAVYIAATPISVALLLDYYGWHFVDSIPVLRVWQTFGVEAPANGEGVVAGLLLLGFRVAIIAWALSLFKSKQLDVKYLTAFARILREDALGQKRLSRLTSRRRDCLEAAVNAPARTDPSLYRIDAYLEYARYWSEKRDASRAREYVDRAWKRLEAEAQARDLNARRQEIDGLSAELDKASSACAPGSR